LSAAGIWSGAVAIARPSQTELFLREAMPFG